MTQDTNTSGAAEPDNVTRQPAWSLGYIDGNWRDIDHQDHDGVMRIVWRKEGEQRTRECEVLAHAVIAALNGVADHDGLARQILRSGGTGGWPGKYFARAAQVAGHAIESCPELNMGNYDEVWVERLNDWAIRAHDEIDRLHTHRAKCAESLCLTKCKRQHLLQGRPQQHPTGCPFPPPPALLMERAMNFVELKRKDGTRFLIDFNSHWEIDDRGGNPALWQNHEQARNMNCTNTYDEVRAKLLKKEDQ